MALFTSLLSVHLRLCLSLFFFLPDMFTVLNKFMVSDTPILAPDEARWPGVVPPGLLPTLPNWILLGLLVLAQTTLLLI